jgi:hypothetical protein
LNTEELLRSLREQREKYHARPNTPSEPG